MTWGGRQILFSAISLQQILQKLLGLLPGCSDKLWDFTLILFAKPVWLRLSVWHLRIYFILTPSTGSFKYFNFRLCCFFLFTAPLFYKIAHVTWRKLVSFEVLDRFDTFQHSSELREAMHNRERFFGLSFLFLRLLFKQFLKILSGCRKLLIPFSALFFCETRI